MKSDSVKVVIIARDFEIFDSPTELSLSLEFLESESRKKRVDMFRASTKMKLSSILKKSGFISAIGILDLQGAEILFKDLKEKEKFRKTIEDHVNQKSFFP